MKKLFLFVILLFTLSVNANQGFSLGATRVIYLSDKNNATISVYNTAKNAPLLIQSWVSNLNGEDKNIPFVITPPLYRQDNGSNVLRIVRTGGTVPMGRESLYYLNVKAIGASPVPFANKTNGTSVLSSKVNIAFVNRIKLFFRPVTLQSGAVSAYQQLTFARQAGQLVINNPTPYYISFKTLTVNGKSVLKKDEDMIAPFGKLNLTMANNGNQLSYTTINDFGGITPAVNKNI